ncbi:RNA polymerase sigma-70 factor (sigma-E family) [Tamaricihabitans halophyticus]|uniref:RNA polymerase sigma-70 factor (Sigma-E family) n=1 Tax=Tamaricihabitans halophyticus TaxID=1262583 RepID=A0A4R2R2Y9_9PSEU|nr:SigE family RNA polymerase sigma factor [Tamaricihabitans halophyticus]TCP57150.1 RNA polymerase sigma-70 factor (sigma-E family) [Tamaricihabitans halophyticus]
MAQPAAPAGKLTRAVDGGVEGPECALVRGYQVGEVADFGEFVRTALPGLLRYGHALTGNPHDAADLVQTVLEKVGSRWTMVQRKTGDPLAYIRRSMANAHISRWRRTRKENLVADIPDAVGPQSPDSFENEPLWQALRELPPRQRAVVVLRYYEGLSEAEIAESLGVSQGTVKSQASKAMGSLRVKLDGHYEGRGEQ